MDKATQEEVVALTIREFLWEEFPLAAHYASKEDLERVAKRIVLKLEELKK